MLTLPLGKARLKQGTLNWERARATRIGSSEVFDIVKYYASDEEFRNCGINAEKFRAEKPYTTAWALYHKLINDGIYEKGSLPPELSVYGHAVEPYGVTLLQQSRKVKLKAGEVYMGDRLIASLDVSGISEAVDERPFDYGNGMAASGKRFICEQKTIMPNVLKNGLPQKYIIQAQYQITMTKADFYILQIMVLKADTAFERGKITQMSKKKMREYLKDKMIVTHLYFQNNEHLSMLIKTCIERFFDDVDNRREPTPYIEHDSQRNILESIRSNTFYNEDLVLSYELSPCLIAKLDRENADKLYKKELQKIIEAAKLNNASRFISKDGTSASFSKDCRLIVKPPKGE